MFQNYEILASDDTKKSKAFFQLRLNFQQPKPIYNYQSQVRINKNTLTFTYIQSIIDQFFFSRIIRRKKTFLSQLISVSIQFDQFSPTRQRQEMYREDLKLNQHLPLS